jgi:hypothetical protein
LQQDENRDDESTDSESTEEESTCEDEPQDQNRDEPVQQDEQQPPRVRQRMTARKSTARRDPTTRSASTSRGNQAIDPYKDADGYAEVKEVINHKTVRNKRQFLLVWQDDSREWVKEEDCDGCVHMLKLYCRAKGIVMPTVKYKAGCGADADEEEVPENWASVEEIINKANIYGNKDYLQAAIFQQVPNVGICDSKSLDRSVQIVPPRTCTPMLRHPLIGSILCHDNNDPILSKHHFGDHVRIT